MTSRNKREGRYAGTCLGVHFREPNQAFAVYPSAGAALLRLDDRLWKMRQAVINEMIEPTGWVIHTGGKTIHITKKEDHAKV